MDSRILKPLILINTFLSVQGYSGTFHNSISKPTKLSYRANLKFQLAHSFSESDTVFQRKDRGASSVAEHLWDFAVVPYVFDDTANFTSWDKIIIRRAMREWETHTCLQFIPRSVDVHDDYVHFTRDHDCGCCSDVGNNRLGQQDISIDYGCEHLGTVLHELGHAIGFWHEHVRPDRDDFVSIVHDNIEEPNRYNFARKLSTEIDSLGENYDFDSIMHYSPNSFAIDESKHNIIPIWDHRIREKPQIGQRERLSEGDIRQTNKLYKCPKCGGTIGDIEGSFSSPHYRQVSKDQIMFNGDKLGEHCEWRIIGSPGNKLILTIEDFDLPYSVNCTEDYLEIRDGYWPKSTLIGKYCGSDYDFPKEIQSTGDRLLITYKTNKPVSSYREFRASYSNSCGGNIHKSSGFIESLGHPNNYLANSNCTWNIEVEEGYKIYLTFHILYTEENPNCTFDYLEIYDGNGNPKNRSFLGRFCGLEIPPPILTTSNQIQLRFVSDGDDESAGFVLHFLQETDECADNDHSCEETCVNVLGDTYTCECTNGTELLANRVSCDNPCGGKISGARGEFQSPNYPNNYIRNKECVWDISVPVGHKVLLTFQTFEIENGTNCTFDHVEIWDGSGNGSELIGTFCGLETPKPILSSSNQMQVKFVTDPSEELSGFSASFVQVKDKDTTEDGESVQITCQQGYKVSADGRSCQPVYVDTNSCNYDFKVSLKPETIVSPAYLRHKKCSWLLYTRPGHRIKLEITHFNLDPRDNCRYNSLTVSSPAEDSNVVRKFCSFKPGTLRSQGNKMQLELKSNTHNRMSGFTGVAKSICGGQLTASTTEKHIYSHVRFGSQNYSDVISCEWMIHLDRKFNKGYKVEMRFLVFSLAESPSCVASHVQINNRERICGHKWPFVKDSSENGKLKVKFYSDGTTTGEGFIATYRAVKARKERGSAILTNYID